MGAPVQVPSAHAAPGDVNSEKSAAFIGAFVKYDKMGEDSGAVGAQAGCSLANAYVVTEKIHGANFCIIVSVGADAFSPVVRFAKRTAILGHADDAEDFYSCRSTGLLRELMPLAVALFRRLWESDGGAFEAIHIYGELFGGRYPHPEVPVVPRLEPVQIGVWYAPSLHFQAFDVAIEREGSRAFLDYSVAREACEGAGLPFAAPLHTGTLAECLDFPIEFDSTIPARLRLAQLPANTPNLAEGVVIRPVREPFSATKAGRCCAKRSESGKVSVRGLFKRKIAAFGEKQYQNDDWRKGKAGGAGPSRDDALEMASYEVASCITEQRLDNVLSKTGRVDPHDRSACRQLLQDLKADVAESLEDEDRMLLQGSEELQQQLDSGCRDLITQRLLGKRR